MSSSASIERPLVNVLRKMQYNHWQAIWQYCWRLHGDHLISALTLLVEHQDQYGREYRSPRWKALPPDSKRWCCAPVFSGASGLCCHVHIGVWTASPPGVPSGAASSRGRAAEDGPACACAWWFIRRCYTVLPTACT